MRWIKRKYKLEKRKGETRSIIRFLFIPKTLDGITIWLEMAEIEQKIIENKKGDYKWASINFKP